MHSNDLIRFLHESNQPKIFMLFNILYVFLLYAVSDFKKGKFLVHILYVYMDISADHSARLRVITHKCLSRAAVEMKIL